MGSNPPSQPSSDQAYAVVVDPAGWSSARGELAQTVPRCMSLLAMTPLLPSQRELEAMFDVGPVTVLEGLSKTSAQTALTALKEAGVVAKLALPRPREKPKRRFARPLMKQ